MNATVDYVKENALRRVAIACKSEMEQTRDMIQRREIIDRHLEPLKVKFGTSKVVLQHEIFKLTYDK